MTPPSIAPPNPKAETLSVSLPGAEAAMVRKLAAAEGRSISTVIRRGLLAAGYLKTDGAVDG